MRAWPRFLALGFLVAAAVVAVWPVQVASQTCGPAVISAFTPPAYSYGVTALENYQLARPGIPSDRNALIEHAQTSWRSACVRDARSMMLEASLLVVAATVAYAFRRANLSRSLKGDVASSA